MMIVMMMRMMMMMMMDGDDDDIDDDDSDYYYYYYLFPLLRINYKTYSEYNNQIIHRHFIIHSNSFRKVDRR